MAIKLTVKGKQTDLKPKRGAKFKRSELERHLGGSVETLRLTDKRSKGIQEVMIVRKESGDPENEVASVIAGIPITGDVILARPVEIA